MESRIYGEMRSAPGHRLQREQARLFRKALLCLKKRRWLWMFVMGREILFTLTGRSEELSAMLLQLSSSATTLYIFMFTAVALWFDFICCGGQQSLPYLSPAGSG